MTPRTVLAPSLDGRDFTKDPPAMLDPASVLRNRARVAAYLARGDFWWPR